MFSQLTQNELIILHQHLNLAQTKASHRAVEPAYDGIYEDLRDVRTAVRNELVTRSGDISIRWIDGRDIYEVPPASDGTGKD